MPFYDAQGNPVLSTRAGQPVDDPSATQSSPVDWQRKQRRQRQRRAFGEGLQTAGRNINQSATKSLFDQAAIAASRTIDTPAAPRYMNVPSFKKGGRMKRRGVAKLHKGERVKGRKRSR